MLDVSAGRVFLLKILVGGTRFPPTWASRWGGKIYADFWWGGGNTILLIQWVKTLNMTYFELYLS